ncbi:Mannose-6-phosphate isomerase [Coemansia sp. RSA 989]|nr:Mannose-6-phosphate isomerase [Coemansia sp. RSA 1821]KAJ1865438.1 Mannose-6-phosphate isomerase [Coemansia sp. RSA 989]
MGTHPSGPSKVFGTETPLSAVIDEDASVALGESVSKQYGGKLPFLFKVLSIEKALSIQAHPDKQLAQKLHSERPDVYKDANHKPEMSIALTDFIALSGFRPLEQISEFLTTYPEFNALVPNSSSAFKQAALAGSDAEKRMALKGLFAELMNAHKDDVQVQLDALVQRVSGEKEAALVQRLSKEYPGDVGCFCVFMLNVLELKPGQAFYMGPNDPHAYIYGDCVECMATSDNVVRAGLTPKLRDVPVLIDMLTYDYGSPEHKLLQPQVEGKHKIYDPPIDEFTVKCTTVEKGEQAALDPIDGPQILLVAEGHGILAAGEDTLPLSPGFVYFVCPGIHCTITSQETSLVTFTAQCQ